MSNLKVLIVGASIAGPTAAYWFAKTGANVTIIERFPELRTNGQSIDIRTVGVAVMRKMPGMEAAVRAKTIELEGISFVSGAGKPYGIMKATGDPDQQSLVSEYEIFRGNLSQIIFDMTKDNKNIKYVFDEQIASMQQSEQHDGPIRVEFVNSLPTSDYDLVIACDGATSKTRAMGLGCTVRDHMVPVNSWVAYFSIEQAIFGGSKIGQAYSAPGGRFLAGGTDPSGVTRVTLMGINARNDHSAMLKFREAFKQGDEPLKQYIAQHYEGAGWKSDEIIKGMMGAEDFYANEMVQIKTPSLYKGRFVMVGDAGYASGPTGTSTTLALAGAYILAGEIGKHEGDVAAGLKGYEKQMRPIINNLQKIASFVPGVFAPQTALGIWLRNNIFGFIAWTNILELTQKYFGSAFSRTEKYKLPDYEWKA